MIVILSAEHRVSSLQVRKELGESNNPMEKLKKRQTSSTGSAQMEPHYLFRCWQEVSEVQLRSTIARTSTHRVTISLSEIFEVCCQIHIHGFCMACFLLLSNLKVDGLAPRKTANLDSCEGIGNHPRLD